MTEATMVTARAPGRVNLIGDHTDYTGGLCFPMAIDRAVHVRGRRLAGHPAVELVADGHPPATVALDVDDPSTVEPEWARFVAGVIAELRPAAGFRGRVTSDVPVGAGLSSSAALEVAVALALGADDSDPVALAKLCQAAEHAARGVHTGLLDQLASLCGVAGHGLLLDCTALTAEAIPLPPPDEAQWIVVHTGARSLGESQYERRVEELAVAEAEIGPLRQAGELDVASIGDPTVRGRARHVVAENSRVEAFAVAVAVADLATAGRLMNDSHRSLRDDFESSTAVVDAVWDHLVTRPGVLGARITGAGWGGCVVALARPGAVDLESLTTGGMQAWTVEPAAGAGLVDTDDASDDAEAQGSPR